MSHTSTRATYKAVVLRSFTSHLSPTSTRAAPYKAVVLSPTSTRAAPYKPVAVDVGTVVPEEFARVKKKMFNSLERSCTMPLPSSFSSICVVVIEPEEDINCPNCGASSSGVLHFVLNNNNNTEVLYSAITRTKSVNASRFTIAIKMSSHINVFKVKAI